MTLLLLAGSGEAHAIAEALGAQGTTCAAWLPEGARLPERWPCRTRRGALRDSVTDPSVTAVLDASHPFAAGITHEAARLCAARGLAYCLLRRPEWRPQHGDRWTRARTEEEAAAHIPPGATVFVATGREGLAHFAATGATHVYCRQIGAPEAPFPFENGEYLIQQPPFTAQEEAELFTRLGIDWLVLRNTGSTRADTKLTAARRLGLNVLMIARPAPPDAPRVANVDAALDWARAL